MTVGTEFSNARLGHASSAEARKCNMCTDECSCARTVSVNTHTVGVNNNNTCTEPSLSSLPCDTSRTKEQSRLVMFVASHLICIGLSPYITRRHAITSSSSVALAWQWPAVAAEDSRCLDDRCAVADLIASSRVPPRLRESLELVDALVERWNALTTECTSTDCGITSARIERDFLSPDGALLTLASDRTLRDLDTLELVAPRDREAFSRNAMRFEAQMKYAGSCARLSQFDPILPRFPRGSYVPKGLKDASGSLLGTNLENARDFTLE